jgi:type I restriction-modification system DNA methylase subunit
MENIDLLKQLVAHFENNLNEIKYQTYNETQVRREFIDSLFSLLGWDIDNKQGYAEAYKDVIHEDAIKVGGFTKAPDYCFRIGGTRKFFVEAKKPGVNIKDDPTPAYQLRRYAWSSKLPLSILTDFEEFSVYDCRIKPNKKDSPAIGRVKYITYKDYLNGWDYLYSTFSREAVLKGSFDRYVENNKLKKGTAEVDKAFLEEIENWRDSLAKNIALRNSSLSNRELNYAVQATIDRIIFLRICGDRGIEPYEKLMALQNGKNIYSRLVSYFKEADQKYNSGLFHFEKEEGREPPDKLTAGLKIDDGVLKRIIENLYYPESPYEFSVIPTEILGQVYEQFLGKVIRLTPSHQAKVENKPEVRKAVGVYYTPSYIVDYIINNTIGKALEEKSIGKKFNANHPMRILDPACGSGSFLLGAYEYLLRWYRDHYIEDGPEKYAKGGKPALYQSKGGEWKLTTSERKRILLNHIYGVDLDSQAVEVTKLSLLLKVLEGESQESIYNQLKLYKERALPDLSNNIKCGNSLIGSDFYNGQQLGLYGDEEKYRINAFDWEEEFPEVFKSKVKESENRVEENNAKPQKYGFDVIIGNPPYVNNRNLSKNEKVYFKNNYETAYQQYDIYVLFYEKAFRLLKSDGYVGFITSNKFAITKYGAPLRKLMVNHKIITIVDVSQLGVFSNASTYPYIVILQKTNSKDNEINIFFPISSNLEEGKFIKLNQDLLDPDEQFVFKFRGRDSSILPKMTGEKVIKIYRAKPTSKNITDIGDASAISNREVNRYRIDNSQKRIPARTEWLIETPAILMKKICYFPTAGLLTTTKLIPINTVYVIHSTKADISLKYLLAILNSKLIGYFTRKKYESTAMRGGFIELRTFEIKDIPIKVIPQHKQQPFIELVDQMLSLNKELQKTRTEHDRQIIQRQIDATDRQIDRLVYELYGLTEDEIKIVEGESK